MKKAKLILIIGLILCLISAFASSYFLTSGGQVKINEMNLAIPSGETVHMYEYRPVTATKANPAPAIVFSHGNDSTLQTHQDYAMELARRGYVVFTPDITAAGKSSAVMDESTVGYGIYDVIDYVYYALDYVDSSRIGIAGYSKGGTNIYEVMNEYGREQREDPAYVQRIVSAMAIDTMFMPTDGFPTGIVFSWDTGDRSPYANNYTKVEGYLPGDLRVKPEFKELVNRVGDFFSEEDINNPDVKIEIGKVYGDLASGDAIIIYNAPHVTHATGVFAKALIKDVVDFFEVTIGAPNPIPSTDIRSRAQIVAGAVGLVGIALMIAPLAILLMQAPFFRSLLKEEGDQVEPVADAGSGAARWLYFLPAVVISFILPMTNIKFGQSTYNFLHMGEKTGLTRWFLNTWQNSIMTWLTLNALIALAVLLLLYFIVMKKRGFSLKAAGVSANLLDAIKAILLGICVLAILYTIAAFFQYTMKVDFRLQDLTFPIMTWDHLLKCLRYAPFVIFFWCVNSVSMNAFNRVKGMSETKNVLLCLCLNLIGLIVILTIHYIKLNATGAGLGFHMRWKYYTTCLLFIPITIAGTLINRTIYRETHNVFIGPVVFGTVATIFSTAVMMMPDYLY